MNAHFSGFWKNIENIIWRVQLSNTLLVVIFEHKVSKNGISVITDWNGNAPECEIPCIESTQFRFILCFDFLLEVRNEVISNPDRKDFFPRFAMDKAEEGNDLPMPMTTQTAYTFVGIRSAKKKFSEFVYRRLNYSSYLLQPFSSFLWCFVWRAFCWNLSFFRCRIVDIWVISDVIVWTNLNRLLARKAFWSGRNNRLKHGWMERRFQWVLVLLELGFRNASVSSIP